MKYPLYFIEENIELCEGLWSQHSCDCLGFELSYWYKKLRDYKSEKV